MEIDKQPRRGLIDAILQNSSVTDFETAKQEWSLTDVSYSPVTHKCPCGQPIKRLCVLTNIATNAKLTIGADCTEYFIGIPVEVRFFDFYKELQANACTNIPNYVLEYLVQFKYIYPEELKFLQDKGNTNFDKLSEKQQAWRKRIVHRILSRKTVEATTPNARALAHNIRDIIHTELDKQIDEIATNLTKTLLYEVKKIIDLQTQNKEETK